MRPNSVADGEPPGAFNTAATSPANWCCGMNVMVTRTSVSGAPMPLTLNEITSGTPGALQLTEPSGMLPVPVPEKTLGAARAGNDRLHSAAMNAKPIRCRG